MDLFLVFYPVSGFQMNLFFHVQILPQNAGRMGVDGSTVAPSMQQPSMAGSEPAMSTGSVMGPGGIPQMGRGMNMPQAGQAAGMQPGVPINQPTPTPSGPSNIPGGVMHGLVMGGGNQPINTGVPVSSGPTLIGAPLVPDNQSRPSYVGQPGLSDGGAPSGSSMPPHGYGQVPLQGPVPQQQPTPQVRVTCQSLFPITCLATRKD